MAVENLQQKQWAKIVAKAWADDDYKQRLLADPTAVMKAEGCDLPQGVELNCVETTEKQAWLVLPPKPNSTKARVLEERLAAFGYIGW